MSSHTDITWRPPGWEALEEGAIQTPAQCVKMYSAFKKKDYYNKGKLSDKGAKEIDAEDALLVQRNERKLRDAWNTPKPVWDLIEELTGVDFKVDPFNNPGMVDDGKLVVKLDGTGDQDDDARESNGLAVSKETVTITKPEFINGKVVPVDVELPLPLHWLGGLKNGDAHAKVNGPHSHTEKYLKLCVAHGQRNVVAAFVPDRGDGWWQRWAWSAQLVVKLGRVHCTPAPAIEKSSPMGCSAMLIWVPQAFVKGLQKDARKCVEKGKQFCVPYVKSQLATVSSGDVRHIVDLGLV